MRTTRPRAAVAGVSTLPWEDSVPPGEGGRLWEQRLREIRLWRCQLLHLLLPSPGRPRPRSLLDTWRPSSLDTAAAENG